MTLAAVVFDFYGTLSPGRTDDAQVRARAAQAEALGLEPAAFDAEMTATVDERFRGAGGTVPGSLRWVAARLGATPTDEQIDVAAGVRLAAERSFGEPRAEAADVLGALRDRGLRIGLISDCSAELPEYFPELPIAPYIDAPVFSFVTGVRKPEPANYLACCAALGVAPADTLYVGDGGSNELDGAQRAGLRPVLLDVESERGGVVYGRHLTWDGERITALGQVLDLV
jgi:putative hydrolase of the HAD superfamily